MPQDLVLLTGATGFVGFRVLTELLDQNYKVRLAVRSAPKIAAIRRALPTRYTAYELEFVVIPDFAIEDAFEGAITGVKYVIHVRSTCACAVERLRSNDDQAICRCDAEHSLHCTQTP